MWTISILTSKPRQVPLNVTSWRWNPDAVKFLFIYLLSKVCSTHIILHCWGAGFYPRLPPHTYSCSFRTVSPQPSIVVSVSHCLMMGCSSTNVFGWYFSGVWIQRSLLEVNCTLCSALKDHSQSDVLWKKGTLNNLELSGQPCSPCSVFSDLQL